MVILSTYPDTVFGLKTIDVGLGFRERGGSLRTKPDREEGGQGFDRIALPKGPAAGVQIMPEGVFFLGRTPGMLINFTPPRC